MGLPRHPWVTTASVVSQPALRSTASQRCAMTNATPQPPPSDAAAALARWRLILGRFAEPSLGAPGSAGSKQCRMDRVLDYLYGREYRGRGVRGGAGKGKGAGEGGDGPNDSREGGNAESVLAVPD